MEEILNNITLLLSNGLSTYIIYRYMHVFFEKRVVDKKVAVLMYAIQYIISAFVLVWIPYVLLNILIAILGYAVIVWCYGGTFLKKTIVIAAIYSSGFVIEGAVFVLLENTNVGLVDKRHIEGLVSLLVVCFEWLVMIALEKKFRVVRKDIVPSLAFSFMVVGAVVLICIQELLIFQQKGISNQIRILSVVVVMILVIIIFHLYASMSTIAEAQAKNQIIERAKNYYHNQAEMLQNNSEELREFRHDLKNKMYVMYQLLENEEILKAVEYLKRLEVKVERVQNYSQSGNIVVDSIINYKLSQAEKRGCSVQTEISLPENISIEDDDLVVILGNLLDNAIEATEKIKENKYIQVKIKYDRKCLFIKVINSFDNYVIIKNGKIQTRKEHYKYHGIGLQSVQNVADKYYGDVKITYDEKMFSVGVFLYSKE